MVKEKGTNTSDVICGKCLVPQAGAVWSRDLLHGGTPLIPSPLAESARRSSLSVLIPITAAVVTCLVGICIYCLVHTGEERGLGPRSLGRRGWAKVGGMSAALLILGTAPKRGCPEPRVLPLGGHLLEPGSALPAGTPVLPQPEPGRLPEDRARAGPLRGTQSPRAGTASCRP